MRNQQRRPFPRRTVSVVAAVAAGLAVAACDPIPLDAGQLGVDGIEVTQSVQYPGSAIIPMIAYKETYVRVYARVGGNRAAAGTGATLIVSGRTQRGETIPARTLHPVNGATRYLDTLPTPTDRTPGERVEAPLPSLLRSAP